MQPSCSPPPAVTQDDDRRSCGGEERVGSWPSPRPQLQGCSSSGLRRGACRDGACLRAGSGPLLPSVIGGEGRSPFVALAAAACPALRPERLWRCFRCHLPPLGRSTAARSPHGCRLRRARASHTRVLPAPPVVPRGGRRTRRTPRGRRSCSGMVPFSFCGEDGSEDLPVRFGATAVRRCGVGGQVAAVVGAEVVAARGGCLCRRDRQRHLHPGPPSLWLNGWFSSFVGEGLSAAAFALRPSLQLSSRPRRRSLSLLLEWLPANHLEFVVPQPP